MILVMGERGVGKTTIAKRLVSAIPNAVLIDADIVRSTIANFGYDERGRRANMNLCFCIAKAVERDGRVAILALQAPYLDIRQKWLTDNDISFRLTNNRRRNDSGVFDDVFGDWSDSPSVPFESAIEYVLRHPLISHD